MNDHHSSRRSVLKSGLAALGAATAFPLLASCSNNAPTKTGSGDTVTLRMSSALVTGENSAHWVWYNKFQELLTSTTNGRIKIQYFPSNQLGQEADVVKQVQLGTIDMMISGSSIWSTIVPQVGFLDMGYLFDNLDNLGKGLDGKSGTLITQLLKEKAQVNIIGWYYSFGPRSVCTKKPIETVDALKGLKIRVLPVTNFVETIKLVGAVPTPLAFGEVYTSLQTGVIDGFEHDFPTILSGKYYEVAKYVTRTEHIYNPDITTISDKALKKVPSDLQAAFLQAAKDATTYQRQQAAKTALQAEKDFKEKYGGSVFTVDRPALRKKMEPLWTNFTTQYPETKPLLDEVVALQSK
jgi:tripartite ATP-independent transporter DctP family solute receptor